VRSKAERGGEEAASFGLIDQVAVRSKDERNTGQYRGEVTTNAEKRDEGEKAPEHEWVEKSSNSDSADWD